MRCVFLSLSFLLAYPSFAEFECKLGPHFIKRVTGMYSNPDLIEHMLVGCLRRHIESYNFDSHYHITKTFSDSDGKFIYYRKSHDGDVLFSERWFTNSKGHREYHFRHGKDDVFYSIYRSYRFISGSSESFRHGIGEYDWKWSIKRFGRGVRGVTGAWRPMPVNRQTYFRLYDADKHRYLAIYSHMISRDGSDRVISFYKKRPDERPNRIELFSINVNNGIFFRDRERNVISTQRFRDMFLNQFWQPLVQKTVKPTAAYLDQEVARYLIF